MQSLALSVEWGLLCSWSLEIGSINSVEVVADVYSFGMSLWNVQISTLSKCRNAPYFLPRFGGPSNSDKRGLIGGAGTVSHFVVHENHTEVFITVDNRDLKSMAGTPLVVPDFLLSGITVQRTAIVFISSLTLCYENPSPHLNHGVNMRNGRMVPLIEDSKFIIESPDISLLSNAVLSVKKDIFVNCSDLRMSQSTIKFGTEFYLYSLNDVRIDGSILEDSSAE